MFRRIGPFRKPTLLFQRNTLYVENQVMVKSALFTQTLIAQGPHSHVEKHESLFSTAHHSGEGPGPLRRGLELTGRARVSRPCREPAGSVAASMRDAHAHRRRAQGNLLAPFGGVRAPPRPLHRVSVKGSIRRLKSHSTSGRDKFLLTWPQRAFTMCPQLHRNLRTQRILSISRASTQPPVRTSTSIWCPLALLSEAWYSGALTPNCSMIYGGGNSERQRSSTEVTHHASERHFPVHMASKSFHEDLDCDTPTSKCIRERENIVHPVNVFGIHSTAHVDDDRDLLWPALLSEARHTGVACVELL